MRWILGIDTRERSLGAMRFMAWLSGQFADGELEVRACHVLEHDELMHLLKRRHLPQVLEDADRAVRDAIAAAGIDAEAIGGYEVVKGMSAERSLADFAALQNADGIVIGRQAGRDPGGIVRLGRVARRLLRTLPVSVTVVPPDLETSELGDGPIVCAMTPSLESIGAARRATELARRLDRDLLFVHAVPPPDSMFDVQLLTTAELAQQCEDARQRLAAFCRAHQLATGGVLEVVTGAPVAVLVDVCQSRRAPLVVCGSRRLTTGQRVFNASLATTLACHARVPVMVVPPS